MKKFFLGLVAGAAAIYIASKLIDDETKEEISDNFDKAKDEAQYQLRKGKRKAMKAGLKAKYEILAAKEKAARMASNLTGKVSDDLEVLEDKLKDR